MKLLLMKVCSVLVLVQGALLLAWYLGVAPINEYVVRYYGELMQNDMVQPLLIQVMVCAVLIVVGLIAFLPSLPNRSLRRSVVIATEHGQVAVQLEALRPALMRVLRKMPEVRKVKLELKPTKGRHKARIIAHISLRQQASLDVRQHVDLVTQHIADTTLKLLGLENLADIEVIVDGIKVDSKLVAREVLSNAQQLRARLAAEDVAVLTAGITASAATATATAIEMDALPERPEPLRFEDEDEDVVALLDDEQEEIESLDSLDSGALPPINPVPSDTGATFESDGYSLPPLSEQELPVEVEEEAEEETAPVFAQAIEQAEVEEVEDEVESELVEEAEYSATLTPAEAEDPFAFAYTEEEAEDTVPALTPLPDDDEPVEPEHQFEELAPAPIREEAVIEEAPLPDNDDPGEAPKKRWSFF